MNKSIRDLQIETIPISALKPYPMNPRTHSEKQIRQIADSIKAFGWTNPILTDAEGGVIAGHGRLEAAKFLGLDKIPSIKLEDMSAAQKRAYILADNKLAENAGWDEEILAFELQGLGEIELGFDIEVTGFEMGEIDVLIGGLSDSENEEEGLAPIDREKQPVSQIGDLWALGPHRILCGDALESENYTRLLGNHKAQMIFTDPPYNVQINGNVCGLGAVRHEEFAMASGEMSESEFTSFLKKVFVNLSGASVDGSIHFICMDWRHLYELMSAGRETYTELKNLCVWAKTNGGMGSLYRSRHELIAVYKHGCAPHINNVELGRFGRNRTNVWDYAGINAFGAARDAELAMHPTVKPLALVEDTILDCSRRGDIVLDAFAGSGTMLIAAEQAGRRGFGIELDPHYVDVTLQRFSSKFDEEPVHVESGLTFSELK